jgi:ATP-binding cassette subfamily G (WHITE) protein 2 (PDR)
VLSNIQIIIAFTVGFCATYIVATKFITRKKLKGEVLLYRRGAAPETVTQKRCDVETTPTSSELKQKHGSQLVSGSIVKTQTAVSHWEDLCCNIKIKKEQRRILDNVDG